MNPVTKSIDTLTHYLPPLWFALDTLEDDIPEFLHGDLVEWDNYEETEIGIGIIKTFADYTFYNEELGTYETLPCAYVTNANPDDPYGYYIPMTHLDTIALSDYIEIYEEEYEATSQDLQILRMSVASKMQAYGWQRGHGDMSYLLPIANPVPLEGEVA